MNEIKLNRVITMIVRCLVIILLHLIFLSQSAIGNDNLSQLRILTWNLENLNGSGGESLFEGRSYKRTDRDFQAIKSYILRSNAEIILLQEIGDPAALNRIIPSNYSYVINPDYYAKTDEKAQLFTAIAFDTSRVRVTGLLSREPFDPLRSIPEELSRATTGIRVEVSGLPIWLLSVHMKSSCRNRTLPSVSPDSANDFTSCQLLKEQLEWLTKIIPSLLATGGPVVVGGDFNRRGDPNYENDPYMSILTSANNGVITKPGPRLCPTFNGRDKNPIDYFVLFGSQVTAKSIKENLFDEDDVKALYELSDHCPVIIEIILS